MTSKIKVIAFDLDDTLLDTSQLLVPAALREAYQAMRDAGLKASHDQCRAAKVDFQKTQPADLDLFEFIVTQFASASADSDKIVDAGRKAFYQREVSASLTPFEGVPSLLSRLGQRYALYLVTAGDPVTQQKKIDVLQLAPHFLKLYFVDGLKGQQKQTAFARIIEEEGILPHELLSVGNRRDKEIEEAKRLGAMTCLLQYGEYCHLQPVNVDQKPDYEISHIRDLISTCSL